MTALTDTLCLQCGMCCNGVLFADVRPESGDTSPLFKQHGKRVAQPCPAFNSGDCTCAIYSERPARCRKFECGQLLRVRSGKITTEAALKKIRAAHKLVANVEKLLGEVNFKNVDLPLKRRFQLCHRAAEKGALPPERFSTLADLQLAMHKLTMLLSKDFYA
jgi:Fe-S-cluster containining protein